MPDALVKVSNDKTVVVVSGAELLAPLVAQAQAAADAVAPVAADLANINAVAGALTAINLVATNMTAIGTVSTNMANVTTVAGAIANVNAVGSNIANVNACVTNMAAILAAPTQAANAAASATAAASSASAVASIKAKTSMSDRLIEFLGPLGSVFTYVSTALTWYVSNVQSKLGFEIGAKGAAIRKGFSDRDAWQVTDVLGNVYAALGLDGIFAKKAKLDNINGTYVAAGIQTLLGSPPTGQINFTRAFAVSFGQSLSAGVGSAPNATTYTGPIALTTDQPYGNLMFAGGVRPDDANGISSADSNATKDVLTSLVPHIEAAITGGPGVGAGETILGGQQAMIMQLLAAYGYKPGLSPFQLISAAIQRGSSDMTYFRTGGTPQTRLGNAAVAAKNLAAGQIVQCPVINYLQGESGGSAAELIAIAGELEALMRASLPAQANLLTEFVLMTYQHNSGTRFSWYTDAQAGSKFIRIGAPMYHIEPTGIFGGSSTDPTHRSARGYRELGATFGVAWFTHVVLRRPWRPLQLSRTARGNIRAKIDGADLVLRYSVPHHGVLKFDHRGNYINFPVKQKGFQLFTSGGVEKTAKDVVLDDRQTVRLVGVNPVIGDDLRIGCPDPTASASATAAVNLRDCQGDLIKFDDAGGIPIHNWALVERRTIVAGDLTL